MFSKRETTRFWLSRSVRQAACLAALHFALAALTGCVTNPAVRTFCRKFEAIKPGMTREQVRSMLQGAPDSGLGAVLLGGTDETWWVGSVEPPNASLDITYNRAGRVLKVKRHIDPGSPCGR
jgi:hypothetical protein